MPMLNVCSQTARRSSVKCSRENLFLPVMALLVIAGSAMMAQSPSETDSHRSPAQLLVSISDKHGKPVSVAASDLSLFLDGQPVPIRELKPAQDIPLRFVVLLDLSNSDRDKIDFERNAATQLFETLSNKPSASGYLGWFSLQAHISTHPVSVRDATEWLKHANAAGPTALYDAIATACSGTLERGSANELVRRILFLITDGEDNQSRISLTDAAKAAQSQAVPIFSLGILNDAPIRKGGVALKNLAKETGGNAVLLDQPGRFLDKLLQPLETQYVLTFDTPPAALRSVQLELKTQNRSLELTAQRAIVSP